VGAARGGGAGHGRILAARGHRANGRILASPGKPATRRIGAQGAPSDMCQNRIAEPPATPYEDTRGDDMSPMPMWMTQELVEQHQADLRAQAAWRPHRRRRRGHLRRWANGWFDRVVPATGVRKARRTGRSQPPLLRSFLHR
jgi:hypothetical protein